MKNCTKINQYYSDVVDENGNIIENKCFRGMEIYPKMKSSNFNNFKKYSSKD